MCLDKFPQCSDLVPQALWGYNEHLSADLCIPALPREPRTDGVTCGRSLAEQLLKASPSAILTGVSFQHWWDHLKGQEEPNAWAAAPTPIPF